MYIVYIYREKIVYLRKRVEDSPFINQKLIFRFGVHFNQECAGINPFTPISGSVPASLDFVEGKEPANGCTIRGSVDRVWTGLKI